ncbi:hypothetical protein [Clostridium formicaceticum]|uniref:DUF4365 domain-containing protein n=1 Tax=Clostridium formicaceticum TaxID=1497 RepID=A0AAC9RQE8_9CLOT|nr:hypothetical protein [Clostridium formicaceticum]AOY75374.1 hypothetical protein BJL90_05345 [Clostridium formicaceticum]ARE89829.1 hypothetical protein CLFO_43120 [Clostridium formicaceticum]
MPRMIWSELSHLQLGKYAEYLMKMEFLSYGFDVFNTEVDDKGVDFVIKSGSGKFYEMQVKSSRDLNYVFMRKDKFDINNESLILVLALFEDNKMPDVFLIPAIEWKSPNNLLKGKDYEGLKSKPEWGINLSQKNLGLLSQYSIDIMMNKFK